RPREHHRGHQCQRGRPAGPGHGHRLEAHAALRALRLLTPSCPSLPGDAIGIPFFSGRPRRVRTTGTIRKGPRIVGDTTGREVALLSFELYGLFHQPIKPVPKGTSKALVEGFR